MTIQSRVCQHLRSIGCPKDESSRYASLVQKWVDNSGPEWTVERLKALKVAFKASLETGEYTLPDYWATRTNRAGKTIVRDGFVHRMLSSPNEGKLLRIKEGFLRIYQVIKLDYNSKTQLSKMKTAVEGESTAHPARLEIVNLTIRPRRVGDDRIKAKIRLSGKRARALPQMLGETQKRSPAYIITDDDYKGRKAKLVSKPREDMVVAKFVDYFAVDQQSNNLWRSYPKEVANRLVGLERFYPIVSYPDVGYKDLQAGLLTVIQEGGAKARWVANTFLPLQALGEPLKVKLYEYTKAVYADVICTDDQQRGYDAVEQWLSQDLKVWSFDCSSFTDRFPLSTQLSFLRLLRAEGIVDDFDIDAFMLVVNKSWRCSALDNSDIRWSVGQPLGYGPSFHLATLTHAAVVDRLSRKLEGSQGLYRIVGDDIVIAHEQLATDYARCMAELGVSINVQKSLISNKYAEFLGKLITREGVNPSIKVKLLGSSEQIVETMSFYGSAGIKWLTDDQRRKAMRLYLPVDLGGKGWRLPNQSYKTWLNTTPQGDFAVKRLAKDVAQFYGRDSLTGAPDLEREIRRRSEFYSINDVNLSASEWAQLVEFEKLNSLTDLPAAKPCVETHSPPSTVNVNNYVHIVDMVTKLANRDVSTVGPGEMVHSKVKHNSDSLYQNSHVAITRHGYINQTEQEVTSQSVIEVTNEHDNSNAGWVKARDVFTGNDFEEYLEEEASEEDDCDFSP